MVHSAILKSKSGFFDKIFDWPGSMDWLETMSYKYDLGTCGSSLSDWDLQTKSSAVSTGIHMVVVSVTHCTDPMIS
jgi:hypothetical protein